MADEPEDEKRYIRHSAADDPRLAAEWEVVQRVFDAFRAASPSAKSEQLGILYEHLHTWIREGIRLTTLSHSLLLPEELATVKVFAAVTQRGSLPTSYSAFFMWIEGRVLAALADPEEATSLAFYSCGDPKYKVERSFNQLPAIERLVLHLYAIERLSLPLIVESTGLSADSVVTCAMRAWSTVFGESGVSAPLGWRAPEEEPQSES